jgi:hypothetical protein
VWWSEPDRCRARVDGRVVVQRCSSRERSAIVAL